MNGTVKLYVIDMAIDFCLAIPFVVAFQKPAYATPFTFTGSSNRVRAIHVLKRFDGYRRCIATYYSLFLRISDDFLCTYKIYTRHKIEILVYLANVRVAFGFVMRILADSRQ